MSRCAAYRTMMEPLTKLIQKHGIISRALCLSMCNLWVATMFLWTLRNNYKLSTQYSTFLTMNLNFTYLNENLAISTTLCASLFWPSINLKQTITITNCTKNCCNLLSNIQYNFCKKITSITSTTRKSLMIGGNTNKIKALCKLLQQVSKIAMTP